MVMASSFARARALRPLAVTAALLASLTLAGCAPAETPVPAASGPAVPKETPASTQTPAPADPAITSEPIDIGCDALLTLDDMYAYNPNVSFVDDSTPKVDSTASEIAAMEGLTCQWANNSSNATIDVAVARLSDDELTELKNRASAESTTVSTYGAPPVEGFFTVTDHTGEAQAFTGSYWVTLESVDFFEPGDVEQLAEAVIAHLS